MPNDPLSIERTADGSQTVYSSHFTAHYHSIHGALQESLHVFIQEGIDYYCQLHGAKEVSILEYGMGTALNVALTLQYANSNNIVTDFHSLEAYPIPSKVYKDLDYFEGSDHDQLNHIHEVSWDETHQIGTHFKLFKEQILFENFHPRKKFDIIFYDAFAPTCQPHLWEKDILAVAYNALSENGILVTFCAKGSFKRALKSLGFIVDSIPGPPRKREMVRGTKPQSEQ